MFASVNPGWTSRGCGRFFVKAAVPTALALLLACGGSGTGADSSSTTAASPANLANAPLTALAPAVMPGTATLAGGAAQAFTTTVNNSTSSAVTWSVDGIAGGNAAVGTVVPGTSSSVALRKAYFTDKAKTQTVSVVAGDLVIVGFTVGNSPATTTVTDSAGNVYRAASSATGSLVNGSLYLFYGVAQSTNSGLKVSVNTANTCDPRIFVNVVSGLSADVTGVLDAVSAHVDTSRGTTHSSSTITTTSPNDYVFTLWGQDYNGGSIAEKGAGFTIEKSNTVANASSDKLATVTGNYTDIVSTSSSLAMGSIIAAFKAAAPSSAATYTAPAGSGTHTVTAACGSTVANATVTVNGTTTTPAPTPVTVTSSPATASVNTGASCALSATVSGTTNTSMTWAVDGVTGGNTSVGTVSGTGTSATYTAPASAGSHTVTATSVASSTAVGTTAVTVLAPTTTQPVAVALNPSSANLATGGTTAVTATVSNATNTAVAWTVDGVANGNATVGTISGTSNSVTYTAPATAGTHTVTATSLASASAAASMAVTVSLPTVSVAMSPAGSTSLTGGTSASFTATVTGSSNTAVTWTVDGVTGGNATVGTLAGTGNSMTYTAPLAAGTHTVAATSVANPAYKASTSVSVLAAPSSGTTTAVVLSPSVPTAVGSGGTLALSATTTGSSTDTVTWSVDGVVGGNSSVGTISTSGVYTCPSTSAQKVHTITATSVGKPSISSSVDILSAISNTTVNAKTQYGAKGDGVTDDTSAINSALSATGNGICYLPYTGKPYMINPTAVSGRKGLVLNPGNTLLMAPGVVLQTITSSATSEYDTVVMSGSGTCNMAVVGGTIIGDRVARNLPNANTGMMSSDPLDFEFGNGIIIANGSHHVVLGTRIQDCCDDGIYICQGSTNPSDVVVQGVTSNNNRRQGISVTAGSNGLIKNCTLTNTNGQDPGAGLDFEPSGSNQQIANWTVTGCTITGNQGGGICGGSNHAVVSYVTINNNTFANNGGYDGQFPAIYFNDGAQNCTFSNNSITGNKSTGSNAGGIKVEGVSGFALTGNTITNNIGYGIYSASDPGTTISGNTVKGNTYAQIQSDGTASLSSNITQ